ncbi:hypothetical protein [Hymenobacter rigui]|uniref:Uncharacterized protein n=1 Tax=Hymenobacter rigui TaxID=334424 RepID=A0A3R9VAF2_9BACT|nr:hypothetical protein [Hymenobacter rigui]RSK50064.1 hypothetical protein EI291_05280 [Hymenobacter rigui]
MKQLFFTALLVPAMAQAQDRISPRVVSPPQPVNVEQALRGSLNPHGLQLTKSTVLYRQLQDTASGRPALRLRAGDAVIIRQGEYSGWLRVVRGIKKPFNFSSDTTSYYMPRSGSIGAKTFILL